MGHDTSACSPFVYYGALPGWQSLPSWKTCLRFSSYNSSPQLQYSWKEYDFLPFRLSYTSGRDACKEYHILWSSFFCYGALPDWQSLPSWKSAQDFHPITVVRNFNTVERSTIFCLVDLLICLVLWPNSAITPPQSMHPVLRFCDTVIQVVIILRFTNTGCFLLCLYNTNPAADSPEFLYLVTRSHQRLQSLCS
jgi:hypothetical protein